MERKICTKCKVEKSIDEFFKDKQKVDGLHSSCKVCGTAQSLSWARKNPEKRKFYVLKSATGLTKLDYENLLEKQENRCAICRIHEKDLKSKLAVDHCHDSKFVRGLLCFKCNMGIGYLNDNILILENAIKYLKNEPTNLAYK